MKGTDIEFWVDPICPWCWLTSRWVVEQVAPTRNLSITWQPISLLFKNNPEPGSPYDGMSQRGHRMLRVMESVRSSEGDQRAFDWYWECGTRIHQLDTPEFDFGDALEQLGLDRSHSAAAGDTAWDTEIRSRMDAGLELVGADVGTPIIAFLCDDGVKRGIFGPVISRMPTGDQALALWDAMETIATIDGFWELKRTRTERPSIPPIS